METKSWRIYWRDYCSQTFLYGSEISFLSKNNVRYRNRLISPGSIINEWFSKTNYQAMRIEPTLPLIEGGLYYQIETFIECFDESAVLLRIVFFDKNEEEIESIILKNTKGIMKYPIKAYSYKIQLINIGIADFCFHSLVITEMGDSIDKK